ncbi:MAG: hypothetical protein AAF226_18375, partial [Verrucomicrobiota bacterium]
RKKAILLAEIEKHNDTVRAAQAQILRAQSEMGVKAAELDAKVIKVSDGRRAEVLGVYQNRINQFTQTVNQTQAKIREIQRQIAQL